jgi:hypothetical protein
MSVQESGTEERSSEELRGCGREAPEQKVNPASQGASKGRFRRQGAGNGLQRPGVKN